MSKEQTMKAVPVAPTDAMYEAGKKALSECRELRIKSEAAWCYTAMLDAYAESQTPSADYDENTDVLYVKLSNSKNEESITKNIEAAYRVDEHNNVIGITIVGFKDQYAKQSVDLYALAEETVDALASDVHYVGHDTFEIDTEAATKRIKAALIKANEQSAAKLALYEKALRFLLRETEDAAKHLDLFPDDLGEAINEARNALGEV